MRFIDWTPVGFVDNAEFESKHPRKSNGQFGKGGATGVEGLASIETVRRRIRLNESWGRKSGSIKIFMAGLPES